MAARQVSKVIEWSHIMQRTTDANRKMLGSFKAKSDLIMSQYNAVSEQKVDIDWDFYRNNISDKAWVNDFEKKFKSFKIPDAVDTKSAQIAEKKKADQAAYAEFIKTSNADIEGIKVDLDRINALPPVEQMTLDDIREHFPSERPDPNDPIYPHTGNSAKEMLSKPPLPWV